MKRVVVAVSCLVLMTACARPPGAAAVVDGHVIDQSDADGTARVLCELSVASAQQQGSQQAIDNADVRRQAITDLVLQRLGDQIARAESIRVRPVQERLSASDRAQLRRVLPEDDVEGAIRYLEQTRRLQAVITTLGERALGRPSADGGDQEVSRAGQQRFVAAVARADVRYSPRYGLDGDGTRRAATGSLSVTARRAPDTAAVPATQRCA